MKGRIEKRYMSEETKKLLNEWEKGVKNGVLVNVASEMAIQFSKGNYSKEKLASELKSEGTVLFVTKKVS